MLPNYYAILGVPVDASLLAIKKAYRAKATASHPDHGGTHAAMLQINEAYEILANPESRRHHDEAQSNHSNQVSQQQAQKDSTQARQQAEEYPRAWSDFESWLARDFTEAEYGQWGYLPTVGNSGSGILFIVIGLIAGGVGAYIFYQKGSLDSGRSVIFLTLGGGFVGQFLHKLIGKSLKTQGSQSTNSGTSTFSPHPVAKSIVHCAQCNQQLRIAVREKSVTFRCPSCQFTFDVPPMQTRVTENTPSAQPNASPQAAEDHSLGYAIIAGIIALLVLQFICTTTTEGFFGDPIISIDWTKVIIGTGVCSFIAYWIGKGSKT